MRRRDTFRQTEDDGSGVPQALETMKNMEFQKIQGIFSEGTQNGCGGGPCSRR